MRIETRLRAGLNSRWVAGALGLGMSLYLGSYVAQIIRRPEWQWDLAVYARAARAHQAGVNPYDQAADNRWVQELALGKYVYPPVTLWAFRPLAWGDFERVRLIFLAVQLLALAGLLAFWLHRFMPDPAAKALLLALCWFGFWHPLRLDLVVGNITVFEQLALWAAFALLLRDKAWGFAVGVAAVACFKLLSLALLGVALVILPWRRALKAISLGAAIFAVAQLGSFWWWPSLATGFVHNAAGQTERGPSNPALLPAMQNLIVALHLPDWVGLVTYGVLALSLVGVAGWVLRRHGSDPVDRLMLSVLTYAVTVPRFKDYAYALVLVPCAWFIWRRMATNLWAALALVALCCTRALSYQPLLAVMMVWASGLLTLRSETDPLARDLPAPAPALVRDPLSQ